MQDDKLFTLVLELLTEDRKGILYRPKLNKVTGGVTSSIFLQQVFYLWKAFGRKPFYKFSAPCGHPLCQPGKSFQEELGMTRREMETARKKISVNINKSDWPLKDGDALVYYWKDANHKTWYALNEMKFIHEISRVYTGDKFLMAENANSVMAESDNRLMAESAIVINKDLKKNSQEPPPIKIQDTALRIVTTKQRNITYPPPVEEAEKVDPGNEFGDKPTGRKHYKWQEPKTAIARRALAACGSKSMLFKEKTLKTRWAMLEKTMLPLASGLKSKYPTEWVERLIAWAEKTNDRHRRQNPGVYTTVIRLPQLLSAIENEDARDKWISEMEERSIENSDELGDLADGGMVVTEDTWNLE